MDGLQPLRVSLMLICGVNRYVGLDLESFDSRWANQMRHPAHSLGILAGTMPDKPVWPRPESF